MTYTPTTWQGKPSVATPISAARLNYAEAGIVAAAATADAAAATAGAAAAKASNLSDLANATTARANLGLGGAALRGVDAGTGAVASVALVETLAYGTDLAATDATVATWVADTDTATGAALVALDANAASALRVQQDARQKNDLLINVMDYGAICDWAPTGLLAGGTGTDNTVAIAAARTAALAKGRGATLFFPGNGRGYRTTASLILSTATNLLMDAPLIYDGAGGEPAISVVPDPTDSPTTPAYRQYRLSVQRATRSSWTNEADVGIRLSGLHSCFVTISQIHGFTVGLSAIGESTKGFVYNHTWLGELRDNRYGVDVVSDAGWNNENTYYGGSFACESGTYNTLDRVGVRFSSPTAYAQNANVFFRSSFEMGGSGIAAEGLPVLINYGSNNRFVDCRVEGTDSTAIRTLNTAGNNSMSVLFASPSALTVDDQGTNPSTILRLASNQAFDTAVRYVTKIDALHKRACLSNGSTTYHIPGLTMCSSATTVTEGRSLAGVTMAANYLSISTGVVLGVYMTTRLCKQFLLNCATEVGFGGRYIVRCYDSAGTVITTAGAAKVNGGLLTYATSYGGAFRTGSDSTNPKLITVSSAVDYVFIGINGGTAACQLSTFAVQVMGYDLPATWTAQHDDGRNRGTAVPTAGTWEVGREVVNATPAVGSPKGWVCTVAGTPGTWVSTGNL